MRVRQAVAGGCVAVMCAGAHTATAAAGAGYEAVLVPGGSAATVKLAPTAVALPAQAAKGGVAVTSGTVRLTLSKPDAAALGKLVTSLKAKTGVHLARLSITALSGDATASRKVIGCYGDLTPTGTIGAADVTFKFAVTLPCTGPPPPVIVSVPAQDPKDRTKAQLDAKDELAQLQAKKAKTPADLAKIGQLQAKLKLADQQAKVDKAKQDVLKQLALKEAKAGLSKGEQDKLKQVADALKKQTEALTTQVLCASSKTCKGTIEVKTPKACEKVCEKMSAACAVACDPPDKVCKLNCATTIAKGTYTVPPGKTAKVNLPTTPIGNIVVKQPVPKILDLKADPKGSAPPITYAIGTLVDTSTSGPISTLPPAATFFLPPPALPAPAPAPVPQPQPTPEPGTQAVALTCADPGRYGQSSTWAGATSTGAGAVTLTYTRPDTTTVTRSPATTDAQFSDLLVPDQVGTWHVVARVAAVGDVAEASSAECTFVVGKGLRTITIDCPPEQTIPGPQAFTATLAPAAEGVPLNFHYGPVGGGQDGGSETINSDADGRATSFFVVDEWDTQHYDLVVSAEPTALYEAAASAPCRMASVASP